MFLWSIGTDKKNNTEHGAINTIKGLKNNSFNKKSLYRITGRIAIIVQSGIPRIPYSDLFFISIIKKRDPISAIRETGKISIAAPNTKASYFKPMKKYSIIANIELI